VFYVGVDINATNKFSHTQLQLAIYYGADASIIQSLVDAGADVYVINKFKQTPLRHSINTLIFMRI